MSCNLTRKNMSNPYDRSEYDKKVMENYVYKMQGGVNSVLPNGRLQRTQFDQMMAQKWNPGHVDIKENYSGGCTSCGHKKLRENYRFFKGENSRSNFDEMMNKKWNPSRENFKFFKGDSSRTNYDLMMNKKYSPM